MKRLRTICLYGLSGLSVIAISLAVYGFSHSGRHLNFSGNESFMFYNCENLFDIKNDTLKDDEEFLPGGDRGWNASKYYRKISSVAKVILSAGTWDPPALVGLCEVENETVIEDMIKSTPLKGHGYKVIYSNSRDIRGIDVCLL